MGRDEHLVTAIHGQAQTWFTTPIWLVILVLCVSCSASEAGPETPPADAITVGESTINEMRSGGLEFQLSLAEDRTLDRVEYERLALALRECVGEAGAELTDGTMETAYGTFSFEFRSASASGHAAVQGCIRQYWEPLGPAWSVQHQPSREQIQQANDALGDCLRRAGEDFPSLHPTLEDIQRFAGGSPPPMSFLLCSQEVSRELKMPNFAGG